MSSREIAELTGKRHDNVRADIEKMGLELSLNFQEKAEPSSGGRPSRLYHLTKRETLILVSGYSVALRARIIDRRSALNERRGLVLVESVPALLGHIRAKQRVAPSSPSGHRVYNRSV